MVAGNGSGDSPGNDGSSLVRAPTRAAYSFADTDRAVIFPIRILNVVLRHYGLSLSDWTAGKSVLKSFTGRSALVENVGELWPEADRLAGRPLDPLDPTLLAAMEPLGASREPAGFSRP